MPSLISVVIPTYKHRDYVIESLESVFRQTYPNVEIVVVNDGSPDDTAEVLRPLAEAGRIVYIEQPNAGQAVARNRGIGAARGEYIALLDDDVWPADKLAWQAGILDAHPETVVVYGDYANMNADGSLCEAIETHCPSGKVREEFLNACWIRSPGQTLIRASALKELSGFDPSIWGSDDWDLYIRLAALGEFRHERRVALHYRLHGENASRQTMRHVANHMKVVRKHMAWNLPRIRSHMKEAGRYFVPRLLRFGHEARVERMYGNAARAHLYALAFQPSLIGRRSYIAGLMGSLLHIAPR